MSRLRREGPPSRRRAGWSARGTATRADGSFALTITPTERWLIEPRVLTVSKRFSSAGQTSQVDAYTRVDLYTEYKIDKTWKVFARGENIFNEHYQEVFNFGTTGRAAYAGFNATW